MSHSGVIPNSLAGFNKFNTNELAEISDLKSCLPLNLRNNHSRIADADRQHLQRSGRICRR
jgi:hypothetical protein